MVYISFDFDNIFSLHLFYSRLIHSPFYQMVQCCCFFVWGGGGGGGGECRMHLHGTMDQNCHGI